MRSKDAGLKTMEFSTRYMIFSLAIAAIAVALFIAFDNSADEKGDNNKMTKKLSHLEEEVIVNKGTEPPFSGKFWQHHETGNYLCKRCGALLFSSSAKFDSNCGWPSFDEALPGAIQRLPDADGVRTEIVCAACGAHLGHTFEGEGLTDKNTRHCVNSVSLDFEPAVKTETAYFAGGCFWGVEHLLQRLPGVISAASGYMGGVVTSPTYKQVSGGSTGHAETVKVVYDPSKLTFEDLARAFFEIHDPTEINRQGPDIGAQYRSAVFYVNDAQRLSAQKLINELEKNGFRVATALEPAKEFFRAEEYHQDYYVKSGKEPYCHRREKRF
ncbi:MAG: bifunctional methionine sulfoxide reductase B/A protein [Phycisphaerae bacterium]|nr:bifunctional methionine sulfoxide reductase B/A protein [Phycisphaerae bacterium]